MKKICFVIIILLAITFTSSAQNKGLNSINQNDLKAYMSFFASDELKGRETSTPMNDAAALYLKTNIMRFGLKPVPKTGDYYQPIPLVSVKIDRKGTSLKINNDPGEVIFSTDSLLTLNPPSANEVVTGKLVFAGYGYENKDTGYNDFSDIDITDKIALIMTRNPDAVKSDSGTVVFDNNLESIKLFSIIGKGPKAILYVYDPVNKSSDAYTSGLADQIQSDFLSLKDHPGFSIPMQISFITQYTANALLKTTGSNLTQMQEKITSTGNPVSAEIPDITVSVNTPFEKTDFISSNVIGIVEGSDPVLRNECVIYTAHFDHEGIDDKGEVFNGADDNASGSMALLEVAEAFMKLKKKPLRTIVFAWVNGEEKGLLGSQYYTRNPVIPLEKTLVDINLDMVGRSKMPADTGKFYGYDLDVSQPNEIYVYTAHESSQLLMMMIISALESNIDVIDMGRDLKFGSSDQASFIEKGVPAFLFHSGVHSDLHTTRDDVEKIDFNKMEKVSKMVFLIGYKVANQRERIVIDNPDK